MCRPPSRSGLAAVLVTSQPVQPRAGRSPPLGLAMCATSTASAPVALAVFVGSAARVLPTLLAVPIQNDLGWQTSDVAWPVTLSMAVSALAAPLAAHGMERSGVRSLLFASLVLLAASLATTTLATLPWHLVVAWGLGLGFSGSLSASILGATTGSRTAHCGARFGLLASMQFLGSAAGLLLASRAVDALGWRMLFHAAAAAALAAAFASIVLVPTSGRGAAPRRAASGRDGYSYPEGSCWRFWVFAALFFICGASTSGLIDVRLGILCMGAGLGPSSSADVLAIVVLGGAIGSAASGFLADRYPARMLLALYFAFRAVALLSLPFTGLSIVELARFGTFYGLDAALTFPALVKLISENLGMAATMGWMMVAHIAGATAASAWVGGLGLAAYAAGFAVVGLVCLLAAGLVLLLKDAPARDEQISGRRASDR
jgi:predicted MFS family arabinose efflux permease